MKIAIYAGSFDVLHNGHVWMVEEGCKIFDKLIVAVSQNPDKKSFLDFETRLKIAKKVFNQDNVEVVGLSNDFVITYAQKQKAHYLLRGIRSNLDYEYESQIASINRDLAEVIPSTDKEGWEPFPLNSVFLMPPVSMKSMSSSMVRGLLGFNGWEHAIEKYVPDATAEELYYRFSGIANLRVDYLFEKYSIGSNSQLLQLAYANRPYHNWKHIEECIKEFARVKHFLNSPDVVEAAIYFHDTVYKVPGETNEDESAAYFEEIAYGSKSTIDKMRVSSLIKKSKWGNKTRSGDSDLDLFHDIDFSIMAADWDRFLEYDIAIGKEYSFYPEKDFMQLRGMFLSDFSYDKVFYTEHFDNEKANQNVQRILRERYR